MRRLASLLLLLCSFFAGTRLWAQCPTADDPFVTGVGELHPWPPPIYSWSASTSVSNPTYEVLIATAPSYCSLDAVTDPNTHEPPWSILLTTSNTSINNPFALIAPNRAFQIAVRIQGCNDPNLLGAWWGADTFTSPPGKAQIVSAITTTPGQITLNFTQPDSTASLRMQRAGADGVWQRLPVAGVYSCPETGMHSVVDRGRTSAGPGVLPPGVYKYRINRENDSYFVTCTGVPGSLQCDTSKIIYSDEFTVALASPLVQVSLAPAGLIQSEGSSGQTDRYAVVNRGDRAATVTVTTTGDFFTQDTTSFTLAPGDTRLLTLTSLSKPAGSYAGSGDLAIAELGQTLKVPVKLLVTTTPPGTVIAQPEQIRVDVASTSTTPSGSAVFKNLGTAKLEGMLVSDSTWLKPQSGLVEIDPGASRTLTFTIDRDLRPDAPFTAGSVFGALSLVYTSGSSGAKGVLQTMEPSSSGGSLAAPVVVSDTVKPAVTSTPIPALSGTEVGLAIPGVGHVTGTVGTFISDVALYNRVATEPLPDVTLFYVTPTSSSSSAQPLAPSQSINLADVVTTAFGKTDQVGTLHIRSNSISKVAAVATVFNKSRAQGTYGTALPTFRTDQVIGTGQHLYITGVSNSPGRHSNLYIQEMSGHAGSAQLTFLDAAGSQLSSKDPVVSGIVAFALVQLQADRVPAGAVAVEVTNTSDARLVAYVTPVDEASGDTWAVPDWNLSGSMSGSEEVVIPVAGAAPGSGGSFFRTDVSITNIGGNSATGTLTYYERNASNDGSMTPFSQAVTIPSLGTRTMTDVVASFFARSGVSLGYLVFTPLGGALFAVSSRTYTTESGVVPKTYGTAVPALRSSVGIRLGDLPKIIGALPDANRATILAKSPATFRTNLGLLELSGHAVQVRVTVQYSDGRTLAAAQSSKPYSLAPHEWRQVNQIVADVLGETRSRFGNLDNVQLKIEIVSGEGRVLPYVSVADNGTSDTIFRIE